MDNEDNNMDDKLREDFMRRNTSTKSFVKVGESYVDLKQCFGFSFIPNPEGYLYFTCSSVYDVTKYTVYPINDRNQLCLFFLELETFLDDENLLTSITALINEVDSMALAEIEYARKRRERRKKKRNNKPDDKD